MSSINITPCFICHRFCNNFPNNEIKLEEPTDKLHQQLTVIFLLRRVLKIPKHFSETLLTQRGDPSNWIVNCDECAALVEKSLQTLRCISSLKKEYKSMKNKIWNIFQMSNSSSNFKNEENANLLSVEISANEIRKVILKDEKVSCFKNVKNINEDNEKAFDTADLYDSDENDLSADLEAECNIETDDWNNETISKENDIVKIESIAARGMKRQAAVTLKIEDHKSDSDEESNRDQSEDGSDWEMENELILNGEIEERRSRKKANSEMIKRNRTADQVVICEVCQKSCKSQNVLKQHILRCHTKDFCHFCEKCGKGWKSAGDVRGHQIKVHPEMFPDSPSTRKCEVCDKFVFMGRFQSHMRRHNANIVCDFCDEGPFLSKGKLRAHKMSQHPGTANRRTCPHCGKTGNRSAIGAHIIQYHTKEFTHFCSVCKLGFAGQRFLNRHLFKEHGEISAKPYQCQFCEQRFFLNSERVVHEKTHTSNYKHACEVCGKEFITSGSLKTHKLKHSGSKMITCELCGKEFWKMGDLNSHQRGKHYKELNLDPFQCSTCGQIFEFASGLKYHKIKHHDKQFLACKTCGAKYVNTTELDRHTRMAHTQEKIFTCLYCPEKFILKRQLDIHVQNHTGRKYKCNTCSKEYAAKRYLAVHQKNTKHK